MKTENQPLIIKTIFSLLYDYDEEIIPESINITFHKKENFINITAKLPILTETRTRTLILYLGLLDQFYRERITYKTYTLDARILVFNIDITNIYI